MLKTLLTTCLFLLITTNIHSQTTDKYDAVFKSLESLSSQELISDGDSFYKREALDSALICYALVCNRYAIEMPQSQKKLCLHAFIHSGNIYLNMYNHAQAQTMCFKALEICQESGDSIEIPRIYNNLGNIYATFTDFQKAKNYYIKAYEGTMNNSDINLKTIILNNLFGVYSNLRDVEGLKHYLNIYEQLKKNDLANDIFNYYAKGWISLLEGNLLLAVKYQKEALKIADSLGLPPQYTCTALNNIAEVFIEMQQSDSVEYYFKKCADIAVDAGLLDVQVTSYRELSNIHRARNNTKQFFHYAKLYQQINDSIKSVEGYRTIRNMEFLFEVNRLSKYITSIQAEQTLKEVRLKNQQQVLNIIGIALFITFCLLVAVYLQKRKLQHSYREIFMRNKEIIASEKRTKERYKNFQSEIQKKDEEIKRLQREIKNSSSSVETNPESEATTNENTEKETPTKYQGSILNNEQKEKLLQSITDLMDNTLEFCNADFTLEKIAVLVNSRPKYVSQVINEFCGKNFNRYVNEYRIKEARIRLMDIEKYGNYTVRGIAQSVGFRSNSNFNILFKEITGITPSMYLEMANS